MKSTAVVAGLLLTVKFISICEGQCLLYEQSVRKGTFVSHLHNEKTNMSHLFFFCETAENYAMFLPTYCNCTSNKLYVKWALCHYDN